MLFAAGCSGDSRSGASRSVPLPHAAAGSATPSFAVPRTPSFTIPRRPAFAVPAKPSTAMPAPRTATPHAAFFAGETALSNGVYYLALPNGNPFGYYSYLPDSRYIYHFDAGYEYVADANDGQGGVYLYDFASGHWWYTSRTFPFPYLYDFTLNAALYYYPGSQPGTYTSNPRWFYDFGTSQIIALPAPKPPSIIAGGCGGVCVLAAPYDGIPTAVTNGVHTLRDIAADADNNLFVASCSTTCGTGTIPDSVTVYRPPYTGTPRTITLNINAPRSLIVDPLGDLLVSSLVVDPVTRYPVVPIYSPPSYIYTNLVRLPIGYIPFGMLFDRSHNLFVATMTGVSMFAPPYSGQPTIIVPGTTFDFDYFSLLMDQQGNLFVANDGKGKGVTMYAPPYTGQPVTTNIPVPALLYGHAAGTWAIDSAGTIFVAPGGPSNSYGTMIQLFSPPYVAARMTIALPAPAQAAALALDSAGNLFVVDPVSGNIEIYAPPYTSAPQIIKGSFSAPLLLVP